MSTVPPVSAQTIPAAGIAPPQAGGQFSAKPEHTLAQIEQLFAHQEEDGKFEQGVVAFAASITGAQMGLLYGMDGNQLKPRVVTTAQGGTSAFTAQQQIDLIANASVSQGASQRATVTLNNGRFALLCVPFAVSQNEPMAIALLLGPERAQFIEPAFTVLHLITQVFIRRQIGVSTMSMRHGFDQATTLVDLFSQTAQAGEFREAISIICNEFRDLVGCTRVAVGLGNSHRCKVYGMSGTGRVTQSTQGTTLIGNCMREAIGVESTVAWPERRDLPTIITSAPQGQMLETMGASESLTIPLVNKEGNVSETLGAWTFLWDSETTMTPQQFNLIEAATPHVAALVYLSGQSHPRGIRGAMRRFAKGATRMKKVMGFLIPIVAIGLMFMPVPHRIGADCRLQPEQTRQVAAPFDGILLRSFVKPGDAVKKGDLLAELDGKDLRWQLAEAIAQLESARKERDQALADKDEAAKQLAILKANKFEIEVAKLQDRRDNLEIRSAIEGLVLSGNLERSQGVPVTTGQKLFDIASIDQLEIEIEIPDAEVSPVEVGQVVQVRLESQTTFELESTITDVYPVSNVRDDENVFVCLATLPNTSGELRPGMRGKARVVAGKRPLGWIIFHRLWDWIRLRLW